MSSLPRRLEALERRALGRAPEGSPDARRRRKEHLDRIAELRRGGATPQNNAELAAVGEVLRRRRDRGEGAR